MAVAAADEIFDDLTCCSICFEPYDEDAHTPKYLNCHHTFCVECIKTLPRAWGKMLFSCPICRKKTVCDVSEVMAKLSNNIYALHMITAVNNNNDTDPQKGLVLHHDGRWCTNCKKEALPSCMISSHHSTFSMGSKSAVFCLQLSNSKDLNEAELSFIIKKRKETRMYLNEVSNAYKLVGETIRRLEDENNVHFAQMNSLLENSGPIKLDETAHSLSLKQEEIRELIEEELTDIQVLDKTYLQHINGKTKITFACLREGVEVPFKMPPYQQEVDDNNPDQMNQQKMFKAATHVLLSICDQPAQPAVDVVHLPYAVGGRVIQIMPTIIKNEMFTSCLQMVSTALLQEVLAILSAPNLRIFP